MINKFQQGGAAPQQGGGILAQIQQLPQGQQQQIMQAFSAWAEKKGIDPNTLQDPAALEQALGQFMQEMQQVQAQAAKHGAKLKFIKGLKHQCAEDEHLEYFAKGGAIGCNCVKNQKNGGTTESKKSAIEAFKEKCGGKMKKDKCGGKMKKHQIGGTLEQLRKSLGL